MSGWAHVLNAALLGTQRQVWQTPHDGALAPALARLPAETPPEQALLTAAALAAQMQRAGFAAPADPTPLPAPAPAEARPLVSATAAAHLHQILHGGYTYLLREWLEAANGYGLCTPPEYLPALLDVGRSSAGLRPLLEPMIGARGRWLAALQPAWHAVVATTSADDWPTADAAARRNLLHRLRQHDPAAARVLLQTTWKTEAADDRVGFLHNLRIGLSTDDAPFLEQCLTDRSTNVRAVAAGLLAHLPQSALVARLTELVADRLLWDGERLEVDLTRPPVPKEATDGVAGLARDGVLALTNGDPNSATRAQLGAHAWLLAHMLTGVPPTVWSQRWATSPAALVAAAERGQTASVLLVGWQRALARHPDAAWAAAVLDAVARAGRDAVTIPTLYALAGLPPLEQERIVWALLPRLTAAGPDTLLRWLRDLQHAWSEPFARAVADELARIVATLPARDPARGYQHLSALAPYFPPTLADLPAQWQPAQRHKEWRAAIEQFGAVLTFRRAMLAALASAV